MKHRKHIDRTALDKRFLLNGARLFSQDKSIQQIILQNEYGAINISRRTADKGSTHAIGFRIDDSNDYEECEE